MKQIRVCAGRYAADLEKTANNELKSLQSNGYEILDIKYNMERTYFTLIITYDTKDDETASDMKPNVKRFFGGYPEDVTIKMYKEAIHLISYSLFDEESYKMVATVTLPLRQLAPKAMMAENEELASAAEDFSKSFKYYESNCLS